ncbi:MAG: response regulator [Rhodospirillaceae bacterium]|nr:response regulator [Rhodospirillaceae bacterium]
MSEPSLSKILYVEDDHDIQVVAQMALETVAGFTVSICSSGEDALEKAEAFSPDLILLDVMMPGMDGPTTLSRLREIDALATVPAVFMTAKVMPSDVERYKELGAADVISKPFDPMTLGEQVKKIWSLSLER